MSLVPKVLDGKFLDHPLPPKPREEEAKLSPNARTSHVTYNTAQLISQWDSATPALFSFSRKEFRENLLPRDSPLVHFYVMLFCAGCFRMRDEFDDSFTLWFDLTMHLQGPFAIYVLYNCCLMLCIPRSEDILLFCKLCELMVISDQPIRWWVHSMYFSADRAPKVYIRLGR